jgi:hypothetical protein
MLRYEARDELSRSYDVDDAAAFAEAGATIDVGGAKHAFGELWDRLRDCRSYLDDLGIMLVPEGIPQCAPIADPFRSCTPPRALRQPANADGADGHGSMMAVASRDEAMRRRILGAAFGLWLATGSFFVLTGAGHSTSMDGMLVFLGARALLESGRPIVPEVPHTEGHRRVGRGGSWYAKFGPGLMIAHLPALLLARAGDPLRVEVSGAADTDLRRDEFYAQLTNAWIGASTVTSIFLCALLLGYGAGPALAACLVAALASPLWTYAHVDSTESLQALSLAGAMTALVAMARSDRPGIPSVAAGFFLGLAVAAKVANAVLVPWFLLFAARASRRGLRARAFIACFVPLALIIALLALYNFWRFGAWLDTGYDLGRERFDRNLLVGLGVLVASPQFGLVVFFPSILATAAGLPEMLRRCPREAMLVLAVFGTLLLVYARWWAFWGMNWGPRFLVPAIPLMVLLLLPLLERQSRFTRGAIVLTAIAGFAVQVQCVSVSFFPQVSVAYEELGFGEREGLVRDVRLAPLRIGLWWSELALARACDPHAVADLVAEPPWQESHRWRDPARAATRMPQFAGVDFWAAPEKWRRQYVSVWPFGETAPKATSSRLRALAIVSLLLGLTIIAVSRLRSEE